jgi:hypothetical protein
VATKTKKAQKSEAASKPQTTFVLRCCRPDMTSHDGFVWPGVGSEAVAPDWRADNECGHGLHGWLHGAGDHGCVSFWDNQDAKWLVVEVGSDSIVMLGGKCKFPRGVVRFVGKLADAAAYIEANDPMAAAVAVIGANRIGGEGVVVHVGAFGTATAGDSGTATAGYSGTATAGYSGTATAGDSGTATAGDSGTATAGDSGTATAGYRGTATAGDSGTATAGDRGTATAGDSGTAKAGDRGEIRIRYWDSKADRYRTAIAYVGEDVEADVAYRLDDDHKFIKVQ